MFQIQSFFLKKEINILRAGGTRPKVKKRIEANFLVSLWVQLTSSLKT
jgi:hypothetical protein